MQRLTGGDIALPQTNLAANPGDFQTKALDRVAMTLYILGSGSFLQMKKKGKRLEQVRQSKLGSQSLGVNLKATSLTRTMLCGSTSSVLSPTFLVIEALYTHHMRKNRHKCKDVKKTSRIPHQWQPLGQDCLVVEG